MFTHTVLLPSFWPLHSFCFTTLRVLAGRIKEGRGKSSRSRDWGVKNTDLNQLVTTSEWCCKLKCQCLYFHYNNSEYTVSL